ncbi:molybdopterin molybdotransferase MoeA [Salinibacillus xinjiangensis]|uniref:Molybdopterin molybdenumtransferase n=1 Tax=Salinibacillus xinjiangensis TaxID=1229268 RepID=A0A6G1X489_9BACI|nr:gephyrin-like molybdotransferase Glp [Salinibacillus xinjiangensis]MRG85648.1 molybdopterin molybdenumtransferase MoeA [Salinibacillus xinjiangensis]
MSEKGFTRFNRKAIKVDDALQSLLPFVSEIEAESVGIMEAIGRRLSQDIQTPHPIPHFRRSGYDGYAVRSEDLQNATRQEPVYLNLVDNIPCGEVPSVSLKEGETARIMTGAMAPDEADTVVMLEATDQVEDNGKTFVKFTKPVKSGANITPIGEETQQGEVLLNKGKDIDSGDMAVLSSLGFDNVPVYKKPKVAVLSTGTELLDVSEPLEPGKIRNSNTYMLAAQIGKSGGEPILIGKFPDDVDVAKERINNLLHDDEIDIIVTTGGVSVGDYDIMTDIFLNWEGHTLFNKIMMRPGSVTTAGVFNGKLLFGLSGNPGACFVGFELFAKPVIDRMIDGAGEHPKITALLEEDYLKVNAFSRFVRGRYEVKEGKVWTRPVGLDQSSALLSMKDANCLIVIPPTKTGLKAGEQVEVILL